MAVQVPPTYHWTLAPQLNPTSSSRLLPVRPTFSAQSGRMRAQVETERQVQEAEMAVQVPPTYHWTLVPQLNPTSSKCLLPGRPKTRAQPARVRGQVETERQVQEAEMVVQVPPTFHGTPAPQLNPTSSGWLLPGRPTFSARPGRAQA